MNEECEHCFDGHSDPAKRSWAVFVSEDRNSDGQPTHLYVCPSGGGHVSESDAEWLRKLISKYRQPKGDLTINVINPMPDPTDNIIWHIIRQQRGYGDGGAARA